MNINKKLSLALTLVSILYGLSGCKSSAGTAGGLSLSIQPATVAMGQQTQISVIGEDTLRTFTWQIHAEDGSELTTGCTQEGTVLICSFDTPGAKTIQLDGTSQSGTAITLQGSVDVLDPSSPLNQAPEIILGIKDAQGGLINQVATFASKQSGTSDFAVGQVLTFDFSSTHDDRDAASALNYELDLGGGYVQVAMVSSQTLPVVGVFPARLRVTDSSGNITLKSFLVTVHCLASDYSALVIDTSRLTITPDPVLNFFLFNASGAVSGGKGPYQYAWDYNGDAFSDNDWQAETSTRAYTIYGASRTVGLKIWDTGCNYYAQASIPYVFSIPRADAVPGTAQGPQIPGYYFIQSLIRPTSSNASIYAKTQTADYIATQAESAPATDPKRVLCDYQKVASSTSQSEGSSNAVFHMTGLNTYDRPSRKGTQHGMEIQISGIVDPTGTTGGGSVDTSKAKLDTAKYFTDLDPDQMNQSVYQTTSGCSVNLTVTPLPSGSGTCSTDPAFGYPVRIDGTFSCPSLAGNNKQSVSATKGAFYCEVAKVSACPPGGGGGGGGIPPIPR